jgi:leucyl aminopeptidase
MSACGTTLVGEAVQPEAELVWVTTRDAAVGDVEDLLGATTADGELRLVESANGNSILLIEEESLGTLAAYFHDNYHRCGGFATHVSLEEALEAIEMPPVDDSGSVPDSLLLGPAETQTVNRLLPTVSATNILSTIMGLTSFPTRYYTSAGGVNAANWLRDRWATMAAGRSDVTVELYAHSLWQQPSVMMTIEGATTPDQYVVIGGHLDSITFSGSTAPGADDDASGVASLTEAARVILADGVRLQKTVVFIAYAAEEVGLRGSNEIADEFAAESRQVAGVMQLDMTNYNGTAGTDVVLLTDYTNAAMTNFTETLIDTYLPALNVQRDACGYACSDHASWHQNGYPTVMPFESLLDDYNPTIHTSGDTLSVSGNNANHAAKFTRVATAWLVETARVVAAPAPGGVLLAQIAYNIPGIDRLGEFVELQNTGTTSVNVGGWRLRDNQRGWRIPANTTIPAGGYLNIARDAAGFASLYGQTPDRSGLPMPLGNTGDSMTLRNAEGVVVDHVEWQTAGWPIKATVGRSIYRTGATDTNSVVDWSTAPTDPR